MLSKFIPFATLPPPKPTPLSRSLSPLNVPELLQLIFSFLNQRSLRTAILVCRQWFFLNRQRLHREVVWDFSWKHSSPLTTLSRLGGAKRLVFRNNQRDINESSPDLDGLLRSVHPFGFDPVARINIAVGSLARALTRSSYIKDLYSPLRELVVSSDFTEGWINNLAFPSTLTSLKLDKFWNIHIDVARIFIVCPLLESLELCSAYHLSLHGPYTERGKEALPARLPLRSLVLVNLRAPQPWLEDLLTITPDLETLKLIRHDKYYTQRTTEHWDWPRLRAHLQSLSLPHKQLHYSEHWHHHHDLLPLEADLTICPNTEERTFLFYDLTPKVLTFLKDQPVFLTSLEILQPKHVHCVRDGWTQYEKLPYTARPLHQLLCECPKLRHLKTLKMPYMTDFMDVHHRIPMYSAAILEEQDQQQEQDVPPPNIPGIWICHGLETLHLELHLHDPAIEKGSHHTRVLYGYIATVCSRLINLRIHFPRFCITEDRNKDTKYQPYVLEGGLCLLSKMRHLERLRIVHEAFVCKSASELNWLAPSGRAEEHREDRRDVIDGWFVRMREEAKLEASRLESNVGIADEILGPRATDKKLMAGLCNLGLLQDVVDTIAKMDRDDYNILPELFKVSCGQSLEQHPEKEMRSLFYNPRPRLASRLLNWTST
ncbi:hypothetical protein BGZ96_001745 [Linnemannia gamsii]|uniref:F-box domain-containing protein n=1 Tax=Linnemannia gamsii TaxID=64522 RepID=A0ABQ7K8S9_9FUNG|nr:hypothetical protein BGZ96_001745 [Linnemannia gamsii]